MAIWYTDNLTGSDTTGDGTTTTPYKTVNKAVSVAANDDTIRVAGSGWSAVSGTVNVNTNVASSVLITSNNLTSELTAGVSLISIKDPQFGNRKLVYKVTGITSATITLHAAPGLTPGTNYEIEKITTNHYTTVTTATTFENLTATGATLTGIKIEGGWTGGFVAQDGITVMTYAVTSAAANGTGFSMAATQTGWSFNNFAFSALTQGTGLVASVSTLYVGLGNIWMVNNRVFGTAGFNVAANITGTPMKLYITAGNANLFVGPLITGSVLPFIINELYVLDASTSAYGLSLNNKTGCTIQNMYVKSIALGNTGSLSGGQLVNGNWTVNNLTIGWTTDTTSQAYVLFGDNSAGKLIANTNLGNSTGKLFTLALPSGSQAQWINTAINIDDNAFLGCNSVSNQPRSALTYNFVKDSEGEKLLQAGANSIFADSTVFDTGTNSLRIKKAKATSAVVIKQHYIPVGATSAITFTIRAKSVGSNSTLFAFQPSPGSAQETSATVPYVLPVTRSLTSEWADYTYTLASGDVIAMAGNYVFFSCVTQTAWTQNYVWIDSVTIA